MSKADIAFEGSTVTIGPRRWTAPVRVLDAALVGDRAVLVLDWTPLGEGSFGQVQNLRAYTLDGDEVWTAEHPTSGTADCYTQIVSVDPFVVANFAGFDCRIDPTSGRVLESVFTK